MSGGIVSNACRYLLLVVFPVHLGAAAITARAIQFTYGAKYLGAIPVLIVASLLSIPRAFQEIPEVLMRAADRQKELLHWLIITGVVNIALDAALIPHFGAVGAAWGNGLSQSFGVIAVWRQAQRSYDFEFPVGAALRLLLAGSIMSAIAYAVVRSVPRLPGLVAAVLFAVPAYILLVKLMHGLEFSDRLRLTAIGDRLPGPMRRAFQATIVFVTAAS